MRIPSTHWPVLERRCGLFVKSPELLSLGGRFAATLPAFTQAPRSFLRLRAHAQEVAAPGILSRSFCVSATEQLPPGSLGASGASLSHPSNASTRCLTCQKGPMHDQASSLNFELLWHRTRHDSKDVCRLPRCGSNRPRVLTLGGDLHLTHQGARSFQMPSGWRFWDAPPVEPFGDD